MGHHMTEEEREDLEIVLRRSYRNHIRPKMINCLCFLRDVAILMIGGLMYCIYMIFVYIFNFIFNFIPTCF